MRAIYLDCFSGLSGNMLLGAFLAAGMPLETLEVELRRLPMAEEFRLKVSSVKKNGIAATYVDVELLGATHGHCCEHGEGHDHAHEHSCEHDHGHANEGAVPAHEHSHEYHHRTMHDVRTILERSSLSAEVKEMSLKIFGVLAQAEGKVHGVRPEDVHFHEVGAVDSIVDIVGTAICLDYLEIEKIFVSRVNTGSGTVHTQHGRMMVPAPATAELLRLFPTYHEGAAKELTTPTGAAVLAALAEFSDHVPTDLLTECIAYGAGTWDLELPNVVRLYIGECKGGGKRDLSLIETNIDDMDAQLFGYVSERLFALGALDVWTTPIYMKKNRPAHMLSVLVEEDKKAQCLSLLFSETTSIGMRVLHVDERVEAVRHTALVDTLHGKVRCKVSAYGGKIVSLSPEYDDCREIAVREGIPLKRVRQEALDDLRERLGE
ncbi:nickel pincer cofactor biosynthesis protein LarC [uncultured Selenomonas sp.]|uniref:nickel pincer cofactor biosynthesis protein LarC n=1 Tax=uncultured Selenomonas sp. TaxID=159275 RepID=UPI0028D08559|nr:nickel pincer cofactor biosynthesis protein LarC [uncultured Selenomonas sp.]